MSDRPGWRVEDGEWVLGDSHDPELTVTDDGWIQTAWESCQPFRLDRVAAGVLARLLFAYAETGTVPMDEWPSDQDRAAVGAYSDTGYH